MQAAAEVSKAAQTVQWIGSLVDLADAAQRAFFDRHPNMEAEAEARRYIDAARAAVAVADAAVAVGKSVSDGDVEGALGAYDRMREALDKLGVLSATAPSGGAETDAPLPRPVDLPTIEQIRQTL